MKKTTTKIIQKTLLIVAACSMLSGSSMAQAFTEGFDDITALPGYGWVTNNLTNPIGTVTDWLQGYDPNANQTGLFVANSGAANSFIGGSFNMGSGTAVISCWLLTPEVTINNDDSISFFTRATSLGATVYPDRLQVRMSAVSGSNVGSTETSVGDFTTLLLDINPTYTTTDYPLVWTQYMLPVTGLGGPVTGRFAFRYFVEDAGPSGANSFIIGIDDVDYKPVATGTGSIAKNVINLHTYPNPATAQVTFDLGSSLKSNATVNITNQMGQIVSRGMMYSGTKSQILDVSNFASGIYSVVVTDNDNNIYRSSFLKN